MTKNSNTAVGVNALPGNSGTENTAMGSEALSINTTGSNNTASGRAALGTNTTGVNNTASGQDALRSNTTGINNTAVGFEALVSNTTGDFNIAIGYRAGQSSFFGSSNIYIGSLGGAESHTIRIGETQARTFIAGIRGVTTAGFTAIPLVIDANGQLGTALSSRRFKEDIRDLGELSDRLLSLRPVAFRYRPEVQAGERPVQYGLIAEEVEQVFPELVAYSADGQVETVQYHLLSVLLLNELKKQTATVQALQERLSRLEGAVADTPHAPPRSGGR